MSATTRRRGPYPHTASLVMMIMLVIAFMIACILWVGAWFATLGSHDAPPSPVMLAVRLVDGQYAWPGATATAASVTAAILVALVGAGIAYLVSAVSGKRVKVDRAIPYLASIKDLAPATAKGVAETASRLGLEGLSPPGVLIGRTVRSGHSLWGSWEDMHVDIWGPRTGKTACRAVPNIVAAPGAVVVTSNKRDVVDATREVRAEYGDVWIFDPQKQAGAEPIWYWNPLEYVGNSIVLAIKLASRMASINRPGHARSDAYFEPAAEDLIANLLLAASIDGRPITDIYRWITRPDDTTPEQLLRAAGHELSADALDSVITAPDRQRAGVYGTAAQMVSFLIAPSVTEWITPGQNPNRPQFHYKQFIAEGKDTLYLLSEETNKMAAPLVVALTAALAEEAENQGRDGPGGRLPVPMLFVLDEAANVCPWKALPDKYSHFGSRGIVMMTILQSWAQGAAAWGDTGMSKLWGAANVRVYGGGVADTKFLSDLSAASGVFEPHTTSYSRKATDLFERNISRGSRSEPVLDVPDLGSMPRGRAFVQLSGAPPVLVRTVPWWEGPYADRIQASLDQHEPPPQVSLTKKQGSPV
ncbi:TraM recognition domain-containing protein [Yinghuangia sp. ASG 101]|uniref:type IV secretory system conjugative DNA transfer family protein n=1 Tax=Yinghuangia sp. ASG 101 TaxID=2896848 RepID=UPI001E409B0C|nr:type IV secretory system conjugative DNA transfer family protein [Yinghuangia sp. ASG 101]UGQ12302.1 TraM recognition domain-containing protein [Yinghuangia sp. ASG 101]